MSLSDFKGKATPILTLFLFLLLPQSSTASGAALRDSDRGGVIKKLHSLQIPFIENKGQLKDGSVRYYARTFGGTVFITEDGGIVYSLPKYGATGQAVGARRAVPLQEPIQEKSGWTLKESFAGASIAYVTGEDPAATYVSYFKGHDPAKWKSGLSTYNTVSLGEIYEGIELKLKAYGNNMEKLFHVKPGADPGTIKVKLAGRPAAGGIGARARAPSLPGDVGATPSALSSGSKGGGSPSGLSVNDKGELEIETALGLVKFTKPVPYQEELGRGIPPEAGRRAPTKRYIEVSYAVEGDGYTFKVGEYDTSKELVIDPLLASTFLGGGYVADSGYSVALNANGNVYVTGYTSSSDFPTTPGAYDTTGGGYYYDAFVARLSGDLTTLLASIFLGGSSSEFGYSVALDTSGNVYVTGRTSSSDFPTTPGAYDTTGGGYYDDAFVARLSGDLTTLLASTFLGGSNVDYGRSIVLDGSGNVYVTGYTYSSDFPTTPGAYDEIYNGQDEAFVARLSGDLTTLLASTFLGGIGGEEGASIALDTSGNVYVTGATTGSPDFPTTPGAYDTTYPGNAFVARLSGDLTSLLASTFIGGSDADYGRSIVLDGTGNVYLAGYTGSTNFPATAGAYDTSFNGVGDAFVAKLDGALTSLLASTFIGGGATDDGRFIVLDANGNVYVAGYTYSSDFPTTAGAYGTTFSAGDVFVTRLGGDLASLLAATFIGGSDADLGFAVALDGSGNVYVAGETYSSDFPTAAGAYDTTFNGGVHDAFVAKLDSALCGSLPGDTDGNGVINILDIAKALKMTVGVPNLLVIWCVTDLNGDGKITILDAIEMLNIVLGKGPQ